VAPDIPRIHRPYDVYCPVGTWDWPSKEEEGQVNGESDRNPIAALVGQIGQAAQAGWAQTARLIALLAVAAAAVALIMVTSR
jgi:hypothetical protein